MVEWNVSDSPDLPDGELVSLKLRALTPDGLRIAIAKHYGLSNYREVQLSHTVCLYNACLLCSQTRMRFQCFADDWFLVKNHV